MDCFSGANIRCLFHARKHSALYFIIFALFLRMLRFALQGGGSPACFGAPKMGSCTK